ncbi:MAG: hypothetical protein WB392_12705 [Methanotrichaceae archaeon]
MHHRNMLYRQSVATIIGELNSPSSIPIRSTERLVSEFVSLCVSLLPIGTPQVLPGSGYAVLPKSN